MMKQRHDSTLAAVDGYQGAAYVGDRMQTQCSTSRTLELIVMDRRKVVCLIHVKAEREADGWSFSGFIPRQVMS